MVRMPDARAAYSPAPVTLNGAFRVAANGRLAAIRELDRRTQHRLENINRIPTTLEPNIFYIAPNYPDRDNAVIAVETYIGALRSQGVIRALITEYTARESATAKLLGAKGRAGQRLAHLREVGQIADTFVNALQATIFDTPTQPSPQASISLRTTIDFSKITAAIAARDNSINGLTPEQKKEAATSLLDTSTRNVVSRRHALRTTAIAVGGALGIGFLVGLGKALTSEHGASQSSVTDVLKIPNLETATGIVGNWDNTTSPDWGYWLPTDPNNPPQLPNVNIPAGSTIILTLEDQSGRKFAIEVIGQQQGNNINLSNLTDSNYHLLGAAIHTGALDPNYGMARFVSTDLKKQDPYVSVDNITDAAANSFLAGN